MKLYKIICKFSDNEGIYYVMADSYGDAEMKFHENIDKYVTIKSIDLLTNNVII